MKNLMLFLLAGLLIVAMPAAVRAATTAQDPAQKNTAAPEGKKHGDLDKLGLSSEQRDKLKTLREGFRKENESIRAELKTKRQVLRAELEKTSLNRGAITALANDLKALQGRLIDARLNQILAIRELVGPEKFAAMKERRRAHVSDRRHEGKGRGEGDEER